MAGRRKILQSVIENTAAIQRAMATSRDHFLLGIGVNRAQLEALFLLNKQSLSVKHLAELLRVTGGAATQMIDSLVAEGFVERLTSNTDRRSVNVSLTPEGKVKFSAVMNAYLERLGSILEPVTDEELNSLVQATEQVLNQIKINPVRTKKD